MTNSNFDEVCYAMRPLVKPAVHHLKRLLPVNKFVAGVMKKKKSFHCGLVKYRI